MISFARTNTSIVSQWWWTVDRWLVAAFLILITIGILLSLAASPAVADMLGLSPFYFVKRQLMLLPVAMAIMFGVSMLSVRSIKLLAIAGLIVAVLLLAMTFFIGIEIKGARRWLSIAGFSLQPSEFIKPAFAVVAAWLFSEHYKRDDFPGLWCAVGAWMIIFAMLVMQPDLGMAFVVTSVWGLQLFLTGIPMLLVAGFLCGGIGMAISAYFLFPHFQSRIDRFMDPASGDTFQVQRSMDAFINGGFLGQGPGEGTVKATIPDVHADFIFAVAGEEFGLIPCLFIVAVFAFIVLRGLKRLRGEKDLFLIFAIAGLLTQFGLQAVVNMASTLNLMPTKGMTLPFISYGGSSLLAIALGAGILLGLTRKRPKTLETW